ncbi:MULTISPECIES: toxin Cry1Ac domain D-VI-related protein [unclassified Listeria]|uniref:toxin Cry1Ac domain D-VI-related protein n=1 Tax=unclassified Listeria TaxID=2642072 RepID=UPI002100E8FE|nr:MULTISPECIES: toxin Cry1Ac domain D-VI-related protein [unclassified Listeria]
METKGNKKIWLALSSFLILLILVSVVLVKHQDAVKAEEQKEEAKKVALEQEKSLEKNATSVVNRLFASEEEKLLSDTYSDDLELKAKQLVGQIENKKVKTDLDKKLARVDEMVKQITVNQVKVESLFTNKQQKVLAKDVTRGKLDALKKEVELTTLQEKAKKEQLADVQKAYAVLNQQEKAEKQEETKASVSNNHSQTNQQTGKDVKSKNNVTSSAPSAGNDVTKGSTTAPKQSGQSSSSNQSSNLPSRKVNVPIVTRMNLASRTSQIITVVASGTSAQVKFWEKSSGTWKQIFSTYGQVGSQGVGSADEYHSRTPRGAYSLGFAFGTSNPGTSLPFRQITNRSYWISNVNDSQYNTWQERNSSSSADEHLASYPTQYRYGVVINYNTSRTKGAGSGFFLHSSNGAPTAGCVAIPTSKMVTVLQKLHSGAYIVNVTSEQELLQY